MFHTRSMILSLLILKIALAFPQFGGLDTFETNFISQAVDLWVKFKIDNIKQFTPQEDAIRFNIFKENLRKIDELRRKFLNGEISFQVGINRFADLTKEEFVGKLLTLKNPDNRFKRELSRGNRTIRQVPNQMDWREQGAVTAVKDQGECASCWAFSAIGSLEGQYYRKTQYLISLSEQNLVDCSVDQTNNGCNGGWMANAFQFIKTNQITSENDYPYTGIQQYCNAGGKNFYLSLQEFQTVPPDEQSLVNAVATIGPISAAMDATNLQFYAGGVFRDDECSQSQVNHGVLVVGYGTESGRDYWLIKNSWGQRWGDNGYFKLVRNRSNQCGIASYGMYPVLT